MAQFKEIGRLVVNDARDIVASQVVEDGEVKGVNFNSFIRTQKYTGFSAGGVFVPVGNLEQFGDLVKTVLAN